MMIVIILSISNQGNSISQIYPPPLTTADLRATQNQPYPPPMDLTPTPTWPPTPTPTPMPTLEPVRIIKGYGNFPRIYVVGPASDGKTASLYKVEGDTATQVHIFDHKVWDRTELEQSPDGNLLAVLSGYESGESSVDIYRLDDFSSTRIDVARGRSNKSDQLSEVEQITSVIWADKKHIVYSKVVWPGGEERAASEKNHTSLVFRNEAWLSNQDGSDQKLLVSAPFIKLLGISNTQKELYVTYYLPIYDGWNRQGFASLDIESGVFITTWPTEEQFKMIPYYDFQLGQWTDEKKYVLFAGPDPSDPANPTDSQSFIWRGNLNTRKLEKIWKVAHGKKDDQQSYDWPDRYICSEKNQNKCVYYANGGIWYVDLDSGNEKYLGEGPDHMLKMTSEYVITSGGQHYVFRMTDISGNIIGEICLEKEC